MLREAVVAVLSDGCGPDGEGLPLEASHHEPAPSDASATLDQMALLDVVVTALAACGSLVTQKGILHSILTLVAYGGVFVFIGLYTLSTIRR